MKIGFIRLLDKVHLEFPLVLKYYNSQRGRLFLTRALLVFAKEEMPEWRHPRAEPGMDPE